MIEQIRAAVRDVVTGKVDDIGPTKDLVQSFLSKGYFDLRKNLSAEEVLTVSEINKVLQNWEGSDAQKAYLQYYHNQIVPQNPISSYDYVFQQVSKTDSYIFKKLVGVLIGAGIPGRDMDDFESWLEEEEIHMGDGYRIETPNKSLFGFIHVLSESPKTWNVSFFGNKNLIVGVRDTLVSKKL